VRRRKLPRPRLSCPVCGSAPRLPSDLRAEVRCGCGARLRVALVPVRTASRPASTSDPARQNSAAALLDGVVCARPREVYREVGSERQRQWGAATDTRVSPGARLLVVAKNGSVWNGTVAEIVGSEGNGHLVSLVGGKWQPVSEDRRR